MKISISKNGKFVTIIPNVEKTDFVEIDGIHFLNVKIYGLNEPIAFCNCQYEVETELPWDTKPVFTNELKLEMLNTLDSLVNHG